MSNADTPSMSNQEVLERAIDKAIDNDSSFKVNGKSWLDSIHRSGICAFDGIMVFNHDFAKALWGAEPMHEFAWGESIKSFDGEVTEYDFQIEDTFALSNWQYHLQQMVIADDSLKYLGEHLDDQ